MSDQCGGQRREPAEGASAHAWFVEPCLVASPNPRGKISGVLSAAYDVAVGLMDWRQLSDLLADALDSTSVTIFVLDDRTGSAPILATSGTKDQDRIDRYVTAARKMVRPTDVSRRPEPREFRRAPSGMMPGGATRWTSHSELGADFYVAGMRLVGTGEELCVCIGVEVEAGNPALADHVREQADAVLPHICRAAEIDRRLRMATERFDFGSALFDRLPFGLVWFGENETVIYANAEADRISQLRDGFAIMANGVRARSAKDDVVLQTALREAIASGGASYTRRFNLKRNGQRPYAVLVTAQSNFGTGERQRPSCVLFITDVDRPLTIEPEAVADMFGLTTGEAKVVAHLAMGVSLREMAGTLKVSINTARTLLARAMAKTGTNTQIALVRMVLTTLHPIGQSGR